MASVSIYFDLRDLGAQSIRVETARRGQIRLDVIRAVFKQHIDTVMAIGAFIQGEMAAQKYVAADAARGFAHALLAAHPDGLVAIVIIPPPGAGKMQVSRRNGVDRLDPPLDQQRLRRMMSGVPDIQPVQDHKRRWLTRLSISMKAMHGRGYAISDWNTAAMIDSAITGAPRAGLDTEIDLVKNGQFTRIYRHRSRLRKAARTEGGGGAVWRGDFSLSGINFEVRTHVVPGVLRTPFTGPAWMLLSGMVLSMLLAYLVYNRSRYGEHLRRDVARHLREIEDERKKLARLMIAVEQTPEGIFISDHEGRIVYANPSVTDMSGIPSDRLIGRLAAEVRGGKKGDAVYDDILSCLNHEKPWHGDVEFVRPDGTRRVIERSIAPVTEDGAVRYHVCVDTDVTEQRQAQSRMEHTQRLESLGVLAGGIAHDFNNILTAVMGNAALGRMKLDDAHPAMAHLVRIEEASQRAADLCKQMLAYSGRGQFVVKPMNISHTVEKITKLLQVSIAKNTVLKLHLAENLPAVEADAAQLQQVIMNLVINASEAIGEKSGVISLSTGMMQADVTYLKGAYTAEDAGPGRYVFLEVADTGCGMDEMTRKKLFDPFFTTKFTGRGLGMSAVLGIVRGHHGAIRVYSEPGAGTTFKMLLPASEAKLGEQAESAALNGWRGVGTVLIVDDEETIRETAAVMLEDMGFGTLTAEDGIRGVEIYRAHQDKIVAVLLDMTMPKLDGKGCFRELRRINRNVRVILSSGYNEEDATHRFAGQGLTGFIQKPYAPEALRAKMKDTLMNGR